jgi:hypothetical protein
LKIAIELGLLVAGSLSDSARGTTKATQATAVGAREG